MGIVTQYHKDTDTTYVYESESYYDPSKKQSRSKRKLIGKLDKETGEIIPTGKRGPKKKAQPASPEPTAIAAPAENREEVPKLEEKIKTLEKEIRLLESRVRILTEENRALSRAKAEAEQLKRENERQAAILENIRTLVR